MAVPAVTVSLLPVLVAAIASMVVGFVWYGPLFGKTWISLMGFSKKQMEEGKKKGMGKTYAILAIGSLLTAYILAHFVKYVNAATIGDAVQLVFWIWLGFIVTIALGSVLWEGKSWKLFFINIAYQFVSLSIQAIILTLWV